MEALRSYETSINLYKTTGRRVLEDSSFDSHRCKILKSNHYILFFTIFLILFFPSTSRFCKHFIPVRLSKNNFIICFLYVP
jgi:prepilin signal peptidase PulO-like enzyme (type II secretory pathway)